MIHFRIYFEVGRGGIRLDEQEPSWNDADAECYDRDSIPRMRPYLYA